MLGKKSLLGFTSKIIFSKNHKENKNLLKAFPFSMSLLFDLHLILERLLKLSE